MKKYYFNNFVGNIYSKPSIKSELSSQILYGEKFKIISKKNSWIKIKTNYDNYKGFIKKDKFHEKLSLTHKVYNSKTKVFKKIKKKFIAINKFLYFSSGISAINENRNFIEFKKNMWVKKKDLKIISHKEQNFKKILKLFLNSKYLWGGKTVEGIDCSALIQIYFLYNRIYFPRDSVDQIKYCKKKKSNKLSKGDIIFWKGHVGICINNSNLIHAYGPKKKVLIMPTKFTIKLIYQTADLTIKKISNIKKY
jgi:hypothetical protein